MRSVFFLCVFHIAGLSLGQGLLVDEKAKEIGKYMAINPDSAISQSQLLLDISREEQHEYGIIKSNFLLGYIYDEYKADFAKAIIYYLEGIRYASESTHPRAPMSEISMRKNCAVIYRKFKAFDLAIEQYKLALGIATDLKSEKQLISLSYNLSGVYSDMQNFKMAIETLSKVTRELPPNHTRYFDTNNRLAQLYIDSEGYVEAEQLIQKVLASGQPTQQEKVDSYQVLARVSHNRSEFDRASNTLSQALLIADSISNKYKKAKAKFECHFELGEVYVKQKDFTQSENHFQSALVELKHLDQKPNFYKVYKELASVYFHLKDYNKAKQYDDLYSDALNDYLNIQEEIQNQNQMYNMDLITKRYYDEVAKQERIASILFYAKAISFTLLFLLVAVIGYNRYEKLKLRKDIIRELARHKIIS